MRRLFICALLGLGGCVSVSWKRTMLFVPPPAAALKALVAGESTLDQCLAELGAPLFVWEYKGNGVALAYGWSESRAAGVSVSVPVAEHANASINYDDLRAKLEGAVLFFDASLKLEVVRRGYLRDIDGRATRRRPAVVPPDASEPADANTEPR